MRFPAEFWIRVAGERYKTVRRRQINKAVSRHDGMKKLLELLDLYPTLESELVAIVHENAHEIVDEYGIAPLDMEGDDKDEREQRNRDIDRIAQGRSQFILSLIEQHILEWGTAMRDGPDAPE